MELLLEMFSLKLTMVKGQHLFNLNNAETAAKKDLNLEIRERTL